MQGDIENIEEIRNTAPASCTFFTYGIETAGKIYDYTASNISFDKQGYPSYDLLANGEIITRISLQVIGEHNIENSLAASALALHYGVQPEDIVTALGDYHGTRRRFEYRGMVQGVSIYDDYAHHPTEIKATLQAASHCTYHELWCVFQPHTYSRTRAFLPEFAQALSLADHIIVTDIYSAREDDPGDISSVQLAEKLKKLGKDVIHISSFAEIEAHIKQNTVADDIVIVMGAGDVISISNSLTKPVCI